jgi:hypothetical protein
MVGWHALVMCRAGARDKQKGWQTGTHTGYEIHSTRHQMATQARQLAGAQQDLIYRAPFALVAERDAVYAALRKMCLDEAVRNAVGAA